MARRPCVSKISAADRIRLDQHLTGIREVEARIARLEADPPSLDACMAEGWQADSAAAKSWGLGTHLTLAAGAALGLPALLALTVVPACATMFYEVGIRLPQLSQWLVSGAVLAATWILAMVVLALWGSSARLAAALTCWLLTAAPVAFVIAGLTLPLFELT